MLFLFSVVFYLYLSLYWVREGSVALMQVLVFVGVLGGEMEVAMVLEVWVVFYALLMGIMSFVSEGAAMLAGVFLYLMGVCSLGLVVVLMGGVFKGAAGIILIIMELLLVSVLVWGASVSLLVVKDLLVMLLMGGKVFIVIFMMFLSGSKEFLVYGLSSGFFGGWIVILWLVWCFSLGSSLAVKDLFCYLCSLMCFSSFVIFFTLVMGTSLFLLSFMVDVLMVLMLIFWSKDSGKKLSGLMYLMGWGSSVFVFMTVSFILCLPPFPGFMAELAFFTLCFSSLEGKWVVYVLFGIFYVGLAFHFVCMFGMVHNGEGSSGKGDSYCLNVTTVFGVEVLTSVYVWCLVFFHTGFI